jgi:hypothetical protein
MRRFAWPALLLSLPASAPAQVVTEMTPQQIDQAIADRKPVPYTLRTKVFWVEFTTPYLRVSDRALKSPTADRSLATPDLIAPELRIIAAAEPLGDKVPAVKEAVVERPDGTLVKPTSQQETLDYAQSTRRKKIAIRGVRAVFPIAALQPGARFRFQLSDGTQQVLAPDPSWFTTPR